MKHLTKTLKKQKTRLLILTTLATLLFTACSCLGFSDPEDELPPITQTGANTFGCIIDGKVLIPKSKGSGSLLGPSYRIESLTAWFLNNGDNNLTITAFNAKDEEASDIYIYIYDLEEVGNYALGKSQLDESGNIYQLNYSHIAVLKPDSTKNKNFYYLSYDNSGSINISRYDNDIISGTFSFRAVNENDLNDIIEITDGRFDIDLKSVNSDE